MAELKYQITRTLGDYIRTLISYVYTDIEDKNVNVDWGRTQAYAVVIWNQSKPVSIRCNRAIRSWAEPALLGLLSHELSHIALGENSHSEHQTDRDVILRGLGPYLAIERIFTNKYSDHIIRRGQDRYLGYDSIRSLLTKHEENQLDVLMSDIGFLSKKMQKDSLLHDYAFHQTEESSHIIIDGHSYSLDEKQCIEDIKFVVRDSSVQIVLDEQIIGEFEN